MLPMIKAPQYQQGFTYIQYRQGNSDRRRRWCC